MDGRILAVDRRQREDSTMMSLLFLLFLVVMILTLLGREKLSFITYGAAIVLSVAWFMHHAASTLTIQL